MKNMAIFKALLMMALIAINVNADWDGQCFIWDTQINITNGDGTNYNTDWKLAQLDAELCPNFYPPYNVSACSSLLYGASISITPLDGYSLNESFFAPDIHMAIVGDLANSNTSQYWTENGNTGLYIYALASPVFPVLYNPEFEINTSTLQYWGETDFAFSGSTWCNSSILNSGSARAILKLRNGYSGAPADCVGNTECNTNYTMEQYSNNNGWYVSDDYHKTYVTTTSTTSTTTTTIPLWNPYGHNISIVIHPGNITDYSMDRNVIWGATCSSIGAATLTIDYNNLAPGCNIVFAVNNESVSLVNQYLEYPNNVFGVYYLDLKEDTIMREVRENIPNPYNKEFYYALEQSTEQVCFHVIDYDTDANIGNVQVREWEQGKNQPNTINYTNSTGHVVFNAYPEDSRIWAFYKTGYESFTSELELNEDMLDPPCIDIYLNSLENNTVNYSTTTTTTLMPSGAFYRRDFTINAYLKDNDAPFPLSAPDGTNIYMISGRESLSGVIHDGSITFKIYNDTNYQLSGTYDGRFLGTMVGIKYTGKPVTVTPYTMSPLSYDLYPDTEFQQEGLSILRVILRYKNNTFDDYLVNQRIELSEGSNRINEVMTNEYAQGIFYVYKGKSYQVKASAQDIIVDGSVKIVSEANEIQNMTLIYDAKELGRSTAITEFIDNVFSLMALANIGVFLFGFLVIVKLIEAFHK